MLERLEAPPSEHGERFAPPDDPAPPRRPGAPRPEDRPGLLPLPAARRRAAAGDEAVVKLETRGDVAIAWLANGLMNSISPAGHRGPRARSGSTSQATRRARAGDRLVEPAARSAPAPTSRRSRRWTRPAAATLLDGAHGAAARVRAARASSRSPPSTASRSAAAASWRWPATCASRRESAIFGQPEVKLGIIPGFGGTQRLPRLVGREQGARDEPVGDPIGAEEAYELGLVNRVVADHELLDTALAWARKLAEQAPLAVEAIKDASAKGDLDEGIEAEKDAFAPRLRLRATRRRASAPSWASASRTGRARERSTADARRSRASPSSIRERRLGRRADRRRASRCPSGIPDFRSPGTGLWENVDPMEVAHIDAWRARSRALLALLRRRASRRSRTSSPTAPTRRSSSSSAAACSTR